MAKMVQKTTAFERLVHLLMAVSGIALLLTGLGFLYPQELGWLNTIFGGRAMAVSIHNWGGVIFAVSIVLSLSTLLPESLKWSKEDSEWLGMLGGYMSKDKQPPPQGKLNAGQKIVTLLVIVFGILVSVSGFMMWWSGGAKGIMNLGLLLHSISFVVFAIIMPLHIYMATAANPGTFRIMTRGDIPLSWAKKKHARWIKEIGAE
ncbi:formate dehydrogenase subunit gamma [bacterium]|nr:MAG: formate dehydrogenase subunit gamma [bacterium]